MKKLFAFLMIVLYTTASSGMVVNMHYCMGKLASVKVDTMQKKACMCGKEKPVSDCCSDFVKVLKVDHLYKADVAGLNFSSPVAVLPSRVSLIDLSRLTSSISDQPVHQPPANISSPPLNVLNCVFRV